MSKPQSSHEDFNRTDDVKVGSDRSFGLVFFVFFAIIAGIQLWLGNGKHWPWIYASAGFGAVALLLLRLLHPLNVLWFKFGMLLHHIVTPLVLGLMFYTVFTPIGLLMRLSGKRPLGLKFDPQARSYWVERKPAGPPPESFRNQF